MTYFMKLTQYGVARVTDALAGGDPVDLTHMAVGDGNGADVEQPDGTETELVREVNRAVISAIYKNPSDETVFAVEMAIASDVGGWHVREVGVFDSTGALFAYGNFPNTYKSTAAEGVTRDMRVVAQIKVASTSVVELVTDTNVALASRAWVLSTITGAYILPGGQANDFLAKASDAAGDTKWTSLSQVLGVAGETELFFMGQI